MSYEEDALEVYRAYMDSLEVYRAYIDDLRSIDATGRNEDRQYRNECLDRQLTTRQQAVLMMAQGMLSGGASIEDSWSLGVAAVRAADAVLDTEKRMR